MQFKVAHHLAYALIYGDDSGLSNQDVALLTEWESKARGTITIVNNEIELARCSICNLIADTVEVEII